MTTIEQTKIPPPVDSTNDPTSIHLSYIRRDIDEIKKIQESSHREIKASLEDLKHQYPSRAEFDDLRGQTADHEGRVRRLELWGGMGVGALALLEVIFKFFVK